MKFSFAALKEGSIHYAEEGSGPAIVLLHGFPEFWYSWRHQLPDLAQRGFRVIAPDLRGYNLSHKPEGLAAYRAVVIADEIAELIRRVASEEKITLVGHDWGAIIAWLVALRHRDIVERLVILNVPHPAALRRIGRKHQLKNFWYQIAFQPPLVPEMMLRRNDFALLRSVMTKMSKRRDGLTTEVMDEYRKAWSQPHALYGALNYYRALFRRRRDFPRGEDAIVRMPTLLIHGERDHLFPRELFEASAEWVPDFRLERLPRCGHFAQQDDPESITALIAGFAVPRQK